MTRFHSSVSAVRFQELLKRTTSLELSWKQAITLAFPLHRIYIYIYISVIYISHGNHV